MIKAVIFDLDGVVSDTQSFHSRIERALLKEYGIDMELAVLAQRYAGIPDEVMFEELFKQQGISIDVIPDVVRKKWEIMNKTTKGRIKAIAHAVDLIHTLKDHGFILAIASSATKAFIQEVVTSLELTDYFDTLVSSYDVEHGKPAPDVFLLAARNLNVKPEEAVVIEDGKSGMIGATAANMKSIGLVSNVNDGYPATKLVSSLKDVTVDMIHKI